MTTANSRSFSRRLCVLYVKTIYLMLRSRELYANLIIFRQGGKLSTYWRPDNFFYLSEVIILQMWNWLERRSGDRLSGGGGLIPPPLPLNCGWSCRTLKGFQSCATYGRIGHLCFKSSLELMLSSDSRAKLPSKGGRQTALWIEPIRSEVYVFLDIEMNYSQSHKERAFYVLFPNIFHVTYL